MTASGATDRFRPATIFVMGRLADPDLADAVAQALDAGLAAPGDNDALAAALDSGKSCLVVWADPSVELAAALAQNGSAQAVLTAWRTQAEGLLDLQRRHRRQMMLVSESALSSDDPETRAQLKDRLGLERPVGSPPPAEEDVAGLTMLLARLTLGKMEALRPLLSELEAASLYCPRADFVLDLVDEAAQRLAHNRERQDLMGDQIRLMAEALSNAEKTDAALAEAGRDRDSTAGELAKARKALNAREKDLAEMHRKLIARENDLAALRRWKEEVFASNSWKVTAPLRRVSQMLGRHRR